MARWIRFGLVSIGVPVVVLLLAGQLWMYRATDIPGLGSRPVTGLQDIQSVADLRARFDRDAGRPRLVVLISPT